MDSPNFVLVPRHPGLRVVLRKGKMQCLNRGQAVEIVRLAMDLGLPIDFHRALNGHYVAFRSHDPIETLRLKHKWHSPRAKRVRSKKLKQIAQDREAMFRDKRNDAMVKFLIAEGIL